MSYVSQEESAFNGSFKGYLGWSVLLGLFTVVTLGLGWAYASRRMTQWWADHTVINGRQVIFTGKARQLFALFLVVILGFTAFIVILISLMGASQANSLVVLALMIILYGAVLYALYRFLFVGWLIKNLHFIDEEGSSDFSGSFLGLVLHYLGFTVILFLTLGFAIPWAYRWFEGWIINHTIISGQPLMLKEKVSQFSQNHRLLFILFVLMMPLYMAFCFTVSYTSGKVAGQAALAAMSGGNNLSVEAIVMQSIQLPVIIGYIISLFFMIFIFFKFFAWMLSSTVIQNTTEDITVDQLDN